ncbi:Na(+)/H(+) exchange regulatory cofactor NHE-RF1 [Oncorhynchus tshawytscha]|uniref:Na(+)/H(+) exchange regulatory cofactor NHE-RF1 n=1 Tax=Oncorhynchus tshawytscha TaxID=74940 RepID=UPI001C3E5BB5|nr:Na(+)/H(+) exchange regulatory cofactor NHE-RF1 [Oncorhynchus tshawytscha]
MIIQVNGMKVEGKQHSEVVAAIKSGGEETSLLVVDTDTDAFFRRCRVAPTPEHITVRRDPRSTEVHRGSFNRFQNSPGGRRPEGPKEHRGSLPVPVVNGDMEETVNGNGKLAKEVEQDSKLSISPSPSNTSSNASLTTPPTELSEPVIMGAIPGLNLSLQQVKERAHQKRSSKRAPPMDWSKKNELFSNL